MIMNNNNNCGDWNSNHSLQQALPRLGAVPSTLHELCQLILYLYDVVLLLSPFER